MARPELGVPNWVSAASHKTTPVVRKTDAQYMLKALQDRSLLMFIEYDDANDDSVKWQSGMVPRKLV
jgi:hypothetical protein